MGIGGGALDFVVSKGALTVGYIEAKDVGRSLDEAEKTEQLGRYRDSLTNLILTDYVEFRWYVDGEHRFSARLGTPTKEGKIKRDKAGVQAVTELLSDFLAHKAESVGTPKELALRMARLAHMIRNLIMNAFEKELESGTVHSQLAAFRDNLIPDLSVEQFAEVNNEEREQASFAKVTLSGDRGIRTPDLCDANAALSQLSYIPTPPNYSIYEILY